MKPFYYMCVRKYGLYHASLILNRSAAKMLFRLDHDIIVGVVNPVVPKISHFVEVKFCGTPFKGLTNFLQDLDSLSHLIIKPLLSLITDDVWFTIDYNKLASAQ